jgi:release factor glutamine methyltransferase
MGLIAMQLKQAIDCAYEFFLKNDVPSPRLNAELLMMFVLGCDRAYLFAHPERPLTPEEYSRYQEVIKERARGCPTQYITGHQEFWGLDLIVTPDVLIPRPETEHVIEAVLGLARAHHPDGKLRIIDTGTGSGCIALALATELQCAEIHACDISEEALEIARINATRLRLEQRVKFRHSDLLGAYQGGQFDFVVSNPPYVGESEADKVQKQVREFEPKIAVFSGAEGMDIYKRLIPQAYAALNPGGWFVTEIGYSIEDQVKQCLAGWSEIQTKTDLQGIPRVVAARTQLTTDLH